MDIKNMKLAYSETLNQFYRILRIDEDVGIIYIKIISNKRDKSIKDNEILRIEKTDYKYVTMYGNNITSEKHFIETMESNCLPKVKLNELRNFKRNMLKESVIALDELRKIAESEPDSKNDRQIKEAALKLLTSLNWRKIVLDNRASYQNQNIPPEIQKLALSKRLFIERRDEFCRHHGKGNNRIPAPRQSKMQIQSNFPCGYLIRDRGGYVVAGEKFTLTDQDVIEFVKYYTPTEREKHYSILHKVPMSLRKKRQLATCYEILKQHNLHYKNEHNYFFWVLDKRGKVVYGGENGVGFKWLRKYCNKLKVTDKQQRSNR